MKIVIQAILLILLILVGGWGADKGALSAKSEKRCAVGVTLEKVFETAYEVKAYSSAANVFQIEIGQRDAGRGDRKVGFLNSEGQMLIPPVYDDACFSADGLIVVARGNQWGVIDASGTVLIPLEYDMVSAAGFQEELLKVGKQTGHGMVYGFVDRHNNIALPIIYRQATDFAFGAAGIVDDRGTAMLIDRNGRNLFPGFSDEIVYYTGLQEGMAALFIKEEENRTTGGFMNLQGHILMDGLDGPAVFSEGLAAVRKNGRMGCIDHTGQSVIAPKYDYIGPCHGGVMPFRMGDKGGYLDRSGKEIVPAVYDKLFDCTQGRMFAQKDGRYFCFDSEGKRLFILDQGIPDPRGFHRGVGIIKNSDSLYGHTQWGLIDTYGRHLTAMEYDGVFLSADAEVLVYLAQKNENGGYCLYAVKT